MKRIPGPLKRLGLVFGVILMAAAYLVAWIAAMIIAIVGLPFAMLGWIATGTYHNPMYLLERLVDDI